jgi:ribose transport system permease protein
MRSLGAALRPYSYAATPLVFVVVLIVANAIKQPGFLDQSNWATTLAVASPIILTGMAQTVPVLSGGGGLDLSVGVFAGFITVLIAGELAPRGYDSPWVLVPMVLGLGLLAGAVNGLLVAYVRLPAIIATLGAYLFYHGLGVQILDSPGGTVPGWIVRLDGSYGPVPGVAIVLALIAVGWLLLSRLAYVRNLLAVGGDDRAAFTAGVDVRLVKLLAYALAGLLAAIGGLLLTGVLQSGDGTAGAAFTVSSISAVALGGIALGGGRGGLLGAALGGAAIYLIQNLLTVLNVGVFQLDIANGLILIGALALNGTIEHLRRRRGLRRSGALAPADAIEAVPRSNPASHPTT